MDFHILLKIDWVLYKMKVLIPRTFEVSYINLSTSCAIGQRRLVWAIHIREFSRFTLWFYPLIGNKYPTRLNCIRGRLVDIYIVVYSTFFKKLNVNQKNSADIKIFFPETRVALSNTKCKILLTREFLILRFERSSEARVPLVSFQVQCRSYEKQTVRNPIIYSPVRSLQ